MCRSQWPRGLRRMSAAARLLRLWVRITLGAWTFVCCECCVLSGRGLCDGLVTRPEESYRLWCVAVCDLETSRMRRPWPALGRSATRKKKLYMLWSINRQALHNAVLFQSRIASSLLVLFTPTTLYSYIHSPRASPNVTDQFSFTNKAPGKTAVSYIWTFKFCTQHTRTENILIKTVQRTTLNLTWS